MHCASKLGPPSIVSRREQSLSVLMPSACHCNLKRGTRDPMPEALELVNNQSHTRHLAGWGLAQVVGGSNATSCRWAAPADGPPARGRTSHALVWTYALSWRPMAQTHACGNLNLCSPADRLSLLQHSRHCSRICQVGQTLPLYACRGHHVRLWLYF